MQLSNASAKPETIITIIAGRIFDPYTLQFVENQAITVDSLSGLICDIQPCDKDDAVRKGGSRVVDLRGATVLPGFVDAHVHCTHSTLNY